jgi:hypothetical protein
MLYQIGKVPVDWDEAAISDGGIHSETMVGNQKSRYVSVQGELDDIPNSNQFSKYFIPNDNISVNNAKTPTKIGNQSTFIKPESKERPKVSFEGFYSTEDSGDDGDNASIQSYSPSRSSPLLRRIDKVDPVNLMPRSVGKVLDRKKRSRITRDVIESCGFKNVLYGLTRFEESFLIFSIGLQEN